MIRIGIICPSEIAFRRFMPALNKAGNVIAFAGIGYASPEEWFGDTNNVSLGAIKEQQDRERTKAQTFIDAYGGKMFKGYQKLIESDDLDAIYLPLPPALHYKWAKMALENGKHVFVEKPSTCYLKDTQDLIEIASRKELAVHENYMFVFHNQITELKNIIDSGELLGKTKLVRIDFGFPRRNLSDFRYNKALGGGALLDAGGYTLKLASLILGDTARLTTAQVGYDSDFEVEINGTGTMVNDEGLVAQVAFGMDNDYHCDIEVWGSKGTLTSGRILTAPVGCVPNYTVKQNQEYTSYNFSEDDAFLKSILKFADCCIKEEDRKENYTILLRQSKYVDEFRSLAKM